MPTNYLTRFATSVSANLPVESTWQSQTERSTGFKTGLARSDFFNRLFAQGANSAYVIGQFVVDYASQDATIDGTALYTNFKTALSAYFGSTFMPLSGGATTTSNWLYRNSSSSYLRISGGSSVTNGANILLRGESASTDPGAVLLYANNGADSCFLRMYPESSVELNSSAHHLAFGLGQHTIQVGAAGYVTTNSTVMRLYIPAVTRAKNKIEIDALVASVRTGDGSFTTPGGSTAESLIPVGVSVAATSADNQLIITLTKSAGWGVSNNRAVTAQINTLTFTVS